MFVLIVNVTRTFYRQQKKTLARVSSSWLRDIWALPHISQVPGVKISPKTEKNQTCSFDRVQEIKVYISFCVLYVSELSGFGGRGGPVVPGWVLSAPTALVPPPGRKPLISSLFCSAAFVLGADVEKLWCARRGTVERPIVRATMTQKLTSSQAFMAEL